MIKIYGPKASSARRTFWTAEECGVEYEQVPVNMKEKENRSPEFLKLNPNGKVPVMSDGDLVLFESMAINTYLGEKYKPELLGKNVEEHGLVYQWSYWAIANLAHAFETLILPKYGMPMSEESMTKAREAIDKYMPILDTALVQKDFLVGDGFTLADLNVASVVYSAGFIEFDLARYPEVVRWLAIHTARPAFQKVLAG